MAKFENATNNILNQLSRARAGQYSNIPSFHYSNWGGAPKFTIEWFSMIDNIDIFSFTKSVLTHSRYLSKISSGFFAR